MDPVGSLSNHFSPRSPRLDGNTLNMSVSRWFQNAIIYLKWLMFDLGFDFPSYKVNFRGFNFSRASIPLIFDANGVWYLWICSLGVDLAVLVVDLSRKMVFATDAVLVISFACKYPSSRLHFTCRV